MSKVKGGLYNFLKKHEYLANYINEAIDMKGDIAVENGVMEILKPLLVFNFNAHALDMVDIRVLSTKDKKYYGIYGVSEVNDKLIKAINLPKEFDWSVLQENSINSVIISFVYPMKKELFYELRIDKSDLADYLSKRYLFPWYDFDILLEQKSDKSIGFVSEMCFEIKTKRNLAVVFYLTMLSFGYVVFFLFNLLLKKVMTHRDRACEIIGAFDGKISQISLEHEKTHMFFKSIDSEIKRELPNLMLSIEERRKYRSNDVEYELFLTSLLNDIKMIYLHIPMTYKNIDISIRKLVSEVVSMFEVEFLNSKFELEIFYSFNGDADFKSDHNMIKYWLFLVLSKVSQECSEGTSILIDVGFDKNITININYKSLFSFWRLKELYVFGKKITKDTLLMLTENLGISINHTDNSEDNERNITCVIPLCGGNARFNIDDIERGDNVVSLHSKN